MGGAQLSYRVTSTRIHSFIQSFIRQRFNSNKYLRCNQHVLDYFVDPGDRRVSKTALVPAHTGFSPYRQGLVLMEIMCQLNIRA